MFKFEVCVDSVVSALAAKEGGAHRVELCESLLEGGVTPSLGKIEAVVRAAYPLPVHVLIRPRAGDFCYSNEEFFIMLRDVRACRDCGAAGIVVGALLPDGTIDEPRMSHLLGFARYLGLSLTLHRSVDVSRDVVEAALAGARVGVDYILTSGGEPNAEAGAEAICRMRKALDALPVRPIPTLIAAGGVSSTNAAKIARISGVTQLHGTARPPEFLSGSMVFRKSPPVYMGGEKLNSPESEFGLRSATPESVSAIMRALFLGETGPEERQYAPAPSGGGEAGETFLK